MVDLNYLAIVAAAIANFVLGMLWYSPVLFGKPWQRLMGWGALTPDEMKVKQKSATPAYITSVIGALVAAYVFAHFTQITGADTWIEAVQLASWGWIGFMATGTLVEYLFSGKPLSLWAINYGYHLVAFNIMTVILALWQ